MASSSSFAPVFAPAVPAADLSIPVGAPRPVAVVPEPNPAVDPVAEAEELPSDVDVEEDDAAAAAAVSSGRLDYGLPGQYSLHSSRRSLPRRGAAGRGRTTGRRGRGTPQQQRRRRKASAARSPSTWRTRSARQLV